MATTAVNDELPSILDHAKRMDPDGKVAPIVEMLMGRNAVLQDAVFQEGNLTTGHRITTRSDLPSVAWRRFNEGVPPSKSRTDQLDETCGMLSGLSKVDTDLAKLGGNEKAFRLSEDKAFMQSMNKEVERAFIYASTKETPEKMHGFIPRLDALSGNWGEQVINSQIAHSGDDQASVLFVCWSPETVFGITPKGMPGGLESKDLGEVLTQDAAGNEFTAWVTKWTWKLGLCIKDPRYVVRLANIDTSAIAKTGKLLIEDMIQAQEQIEDEQMGRCAIYCNRKIRTYLRLQATDSTKNSTITFDDIGGKRVLTFGGWPVRRTDALLNTESVVA